MASTGMGDSYPLELNTINRFVSRTSPGAYALGYAGQDGTFYIQRTGRADDDVNDRLKDHVGKYERFKFAYCATAEEAYRLECRLFHDFPKAGDNKIHPDAPDHTNLTCPICGV